MQEHKTNGEIMKKPNLSISDNVKKKKFLSGLIKSWPLILMIFPGFTYMIINNYLPMYGITIAFRELDFSLDNVMFSPFNGFANFEFLFQTDYIWIAARNTLLYNVVFIVLGIIIPVSVAILFNTITSKFAKRVYQTNILLPNLMSWVIVSYIAFAFLGNENGFINSLLNSARGYKIDFYTEPKYWPFILTFFHFWKGIGISMVVYLSSILGISQEYYESAKLDGAGFFKQVWYITLPCLKPTIIMLFILSVSKIFYSDFGLFYLVPKNSGPLSDVTQTIDTFVFNALKGAGDYASSSTASVLQSIFGFILILIANYTIRKVDPDNALF